LCGSIYFGFISNETDPHNHLKLFGLVFIKQIKSNYYPTSVFLQIIKKYLKFFIFSILLIGIFIQENPCLAQSSKNKNLIVTLLAAGQGDSIVIQTPKGKTYLIDTGPNETLFGGSFDAGKEAVVPFLKFNKIAFLDGILITHPHLDHYGGTFTVLENFKVKQFMDSGIKTRAPPYIKLLSQLEKNGVEYKIVKEKDKLNWERSLKIEILAPTKELAPNIEEKNNVNNRSIVLKLTYKSVSFLFTGDIEKETEEVLAKKLKRKLKSKILKVAHHGSKTSSTMVFLMRVDPEVALLSCGVKNPFGHPHALILNRFNDLGVKIYRTDQDGTIQIITDGKKYEVKTSKGS